MSAVKEGQVMVSWECEVSGELEELDDCGVRNCTKVENSVGIMLIVRYFWFVEIPD